MIVVSVMWAATNSFAEQPSSPNSFCSLGTSVPVLQKIPLTPLELRAQFKDRVPVAVAAGFRSSSCHPLLSCVLTQLLVRLGRQPNQGTKPSIKNKTFESSCIIEPPSKSGGKGKAVQVSQQLEPQTGFELANRGFSF